MENKRSIQFNRDSFLGGGLLLYGGGLFLLIRGLVVLMMGFGQMSWVPTAALVTESSTYTYRSQEQDKTGYAFEYEYVVDGETYQSSRYSAAQIGNSEIQGVERHSAGERITVFVNPDNPKQAVVVQKRPIPFVYLGMLLGALFVVVATTMTFSNGRG